MVVAYLTIHDDLWPTESAKPTSRSGGPDLLWTEYSVLATHEENSKDKWTCCFSEDKLFWTHITANKNDLMTQILGTETLKKIYTFQGIRAYFYIILKINCGGSIFRPFLHSVIDYLNYFAESRLKKVMLIFTCSSIQSEFQFLCNMWGIRICKLKFKSLWVTSHVDE
jgi:hypothetical protein